jgi:phosphoribosylaminoimidazolecarboxamide formyltransferase/IMP cyclohydrolase
MSDLKFAWKAVRYVKSNAILFCKNRQILAIGGGQTSRIDSFDVAIRKAERTGVSLQGSVVASDAFFPFADAIKAMQNAGASAVIQPGGSVRDDEVIEAADNANIAMVQTGFRIFRH